MIEFRCHCTASQERRGGCISAVQEQQTKTLVRKVRMYSTNQSPVICIDDTRFRILDQLRTVLLMA